MFKITTCKFLAKVSKKTLQNCGESKNTMFLLTIMLIYFSLDLGITWISILSKLFSSLKIICPS